MEKQKLRGTVIFSLIFFLFFMVVFPSAQLATEKNIIWTWSYAGGLFMIALFLAMTMGYGITFILSKLNAVKKEAFSKRNKGNFFLFYGLTVLAWLPAYLAYYPGIFSYDITIQGEQILSHQYIEHHPLAHTLLVEAFWHLGCFFGKVNLGMGLYTLVQLLFVAFAFSYGMNVLWKKGLGKGYVLMIQLYAMFFPFHWYMSLSATKDSLFAGFVLLFLILMYEILSGNEEKISKKSILLVFSGVGMILFRNNAKYAILAFAGLLLIVACMQKKKYLWFLFTNTMVILLVGSALLVTLSKAVNATQGDKREMLSIPIQQFSRLMLFHEEELVSEDRALIDRFLPDRAYDYYRPDIADPVKKRTVTSVFRYELPAFVKTYVHGFLLYPEDYINAFLTVDAGYLYPFDESHAWINVNGRDSGLGYVQTRWVEQELENLEIRKESKFPRLHRWLEKWADQNAYLKLPLLRYLFMPGCYFWFWLLLLGHCIWKKNLKKSLPVCFALFYLLTLLLGPTVQLRYLYPFMISLPFLLLFFISEKPNVAD